MAYDLDIVFPIGEDDIEDVLTQNFSEVEAKILRARMQDGGRDFMEAFGKHMRGGAFLHNTSVIECAHLAIEMFLENELAEIHRQIPNVPFSPQ